MTSFLVCETMIDDCFCTASAVGRESPERCNLFGLLGNFQRCLQCGSEKFPNKLWYFPPVNIRAAAESLSLHFQPSLLRWLHYPPCGLDLRLLLHRLCRLGQRLTAQVIVQILVAPVIVGEVTEASGKLFSQFLICPYPCLVIVEQAVDELISVQRIYGFGNIGNRIEDNVILPVKVRHGRAVLHP